MVQTEPWYNTSDQKVIREWWDGASAGAGGNPAGTVGCGIEKTVLFWPLPQGVVDKTLCSLNTTWPLDASKSHLLTLWYLSRKFTICVDSHILPYVSPVTIHRIPGWPTNQCFSFHEVGVCRITCAFFHPVPHMERMCSLHSKDDWAELNSPVLSCVQSNHLKSSWLRWTHFTIIYTRRVVDTAAQLSRSCTVAAIEHWGVSVYAYWTSNVSRVKRVHLIVKYPERLFVWLICYKSDIFGYEMMQ